MVPFQTSRGETCHTSTEQGRRARNNHSVYSKIRPKQGFKSCTILIRDVELNLMIDLASTNPCTRSSTWSIPSALQSQHSYPTTMVASTSLVWCTYLSNTKTIDSFPFYVTRQGTSLMRTDLFNQLSFKVTHNGTEIQTVEFAFKFPQAFGEFGKISKFVQRPRIAPIVKAVSQKLRRLPLSLREEVSRELHHLEEQDVIEKIDALPWISNLVVVRRKTGEIRLCVDVRAVNKAIIPIHCTTWHATYSGRPQCNFLLGLVKQHEAKSKEM